MLFRNPVIITGLPRSGTTKTQFILTKLRNTVIFNELYLYLVGKDSFRGLIRTKIDECCRFKEDRLPWAWTLQAAIHLPRSQREKLKLLVNNERVFITEMYKSFGKLRLYGDKAPEYLFHIPYLVQKYNPKFILLLRDVRDCICSSILNWRKWYDKVPLDSHPWMHPRVEEAEKYFLSYLETELEYWSMMKGRLFVIRCEEMVKSNTAMISSLAKFLDVDANELNSICSRYLSEKYPRRWLEMFPGGMKLSTETLELQGEIIKLSEDTN